MLSIDVFFWSLIGWMHRCEVWGYEGPTVQIKAFLCWVCVCVWWVRAGVLLDLSHLCIYGGPWGISGISEAQWDELCKQIWLCTAPSSTLLWASQDGDEISDWQHSFFQSHPWKKIFPSICLLSFFVNLLYFYQQLRMGEATREKRKWRLRVESIREKGE